MSTEIRLLRADEIDCRPQQVRDTKTGTGLYLLLYKDSRADMKVLDETFGIFGWQRRHEFKDGKNYCTVSIWAGDERGWVSKEDMGTESFAEAEKGEACDSFKRACFNIGIGRELYTSPFIWIQLDESEVKVANGKPACYTKFKVYEIGYDENRNINLLTIVDEKDKTRYHFDADKKKRPISLDSINGAVERDQLMKWLDKQKHDLMTNKKPFSIHELIDKHYRCTKEVKQKIEALYFEYVERQKQE